MTPRLAAGYMFLGQTVELFTGESTEYIETMLETLVIFCTRVK